MLFFLNWRLNLLLFLCFLLLFLFLFISYFFVLIKNDKTCKNVPQCCMLIKTKGQKINESKEFLFILIIIIISSPYLSTSSNFTPLLCLSEAPCSGAPCPRRQTPLRPRHRCCLHHHHHPSRWWRRSLSVGTDTTAAAPGCRSAPAGRRWWSLEGGRPEKTCHSTKLDGSIQHKGEADEVWSCVCGSRPMELNLTEECSDNFQLNLNKAGFRHFTSTTENSKNNDDKTSKRCQSSPTSNQSCKISIIHGDAWKTSTSKCVTGILGAIQLYRRQFVKKM